MPQLKREKHLKVHPPTFEMELKGKLGQSSVNGLLNNSLSLNLCQCIHDLLKSRISNLVHSALRKKDGSIRYTHIKVTRTQGYFTHDINGGGDNMYTADNICKMIELLIANIFVQFGGRLFCQVIGIPMGTNCAPLLADLFVYDQRWPQ